MRGKTILLVITLVLSVAFSPVFSQLDLKEKAQLVGIQVDEKPGATNQEKLTDISFIFTGKPSVYYHNYKDSVLTIEFYDAEPGEGKLPTVDQAPFSGSTLTKDKVDVNKDIEGLQPVLKDVVRLALPVRSGIAIDYTMSDDFNVVTLSTVWSAGGALVTKKTQKKTRTWMYVTGGIVGVTAGVISYIVLKSDPTPPPPPPPPAWNPPEPVMPPDP